MHVLGFKRSSLLGVFLLPVLLPGALKAQLRTVVSNEIAVSGREATLHLVFEDHQALTVSLQEGQVLVDDESVGSFDRGDALDLAWRSLLGDVISLDDGPLASALFEWSPPEELTGSAGEVAAVLDQALEGALARPEVAEGPEETAEITLTLSDENSLLSALLRRSDALQGLAEALKGVSLEDFTLRIGEDLDVEAGEELDESVILVDGDLDLEGVIRGDVIVTNGSVRLLEGGRITGDLRVVDGEVESLGGEVEGQLIQPSGEEVVSFDSSELRALREELEREIRRDVLSSMEREGRSSSRSFLNPFRNVGRALAGLFENLVAFLVLAILGTLVLHFARERLEVVATTARRAPAQSAMVGLAGGFLLIPVWILGIVALAISIIGIPVLLAWIPLFPIAVGLAGLLGYVAVARNVGEWVADQEYRGLEWIRGSNSFYVVIAGLGALMVPAVAASLVRILGFGLLQGLLGFLGSAITFVALAIGFGAVLLTRGGRIRPYAAYYDFEEALWAEEDEEDAPGEPVSHEGSTEDVPAPEPADQESPPDEAGPRGPSTSGE
jgi:hypothetical protein